MTVSVILYKRMGISNTDLLSIPVGSTCHGIETFMESLCDCWKRTWWLSPCSYDRRRISRSGFYNTASIFLSATLAFFWLLAFSSATIHCRRWFLHAGSFEHDQAMYVGIRNTFYRIAMITGQGALIILAVLWNFSQDCSRNIKVEYQPSLTTQTQIIATKKAVTWFIIEPSLLTFHQTSISQDSAKKLRLGNITELNPWICCGWNNQSEEWHERVMVSSAVSKLWEIGFIIIFVKKESPCN